MYFLYYKYMATKFLNRYGNGLNEVNYDSTQYLPTTGTAAAANKLATARTISLSGRVTGSANFDGSRNITINTSGADRYKRACVVCKDTGDNPTANPYFKFAEFNSAGSNNDNDYIFLIEKGWSSSANQMGILKCHLRTGGNNQMENIQLMWLVVTSTMNTGDISACYKNMGSYVNVQLYALCNAAWMPCKITLLSESWRTSIQDDNIQLFSTTTGVAGAPSGYSTIWPSVCDLHNNNYNSRITTLENWMNKYNSMLNIIGNNA